MADSTIVKTAGYSFQRRDETATPLCGAHRIASHAKNPLLVKAQLGAVKATTYSLPEDFQHEYGLRQERDGVTAGDVVDNWADNDGSHSAVAARDFRALNKAAISSGHLDVKAMNEYRNEHDIRVKLGNEKGRAARGGGNYDDNTAFGRPTRPSTPFGDLVSHGFRYDWVMQSEPASAVAQSRARQKPRGTIASMGHASRAAAARAGDTAAANPAAPWKMKKFANVQSKVGRQG